MNLKKNFTRGQENAQDDLNSNFQNIEIACNELSTSVEDTGWINIPASSGYSWSKQGQVRRVGKTVMFRGELTATSTLGDFTVIPEGFRPGTVAENYEMQYDLPKKSSDVTQRARVYVRPNGTIALIGTSSSPAATFLAPITYFVD